MRVAEQSVYMKTKLKVPAVALMMGAALGCVTGLLLSCTKQRASALKPIDQAALQTMVETTAKELMNLAPWFSCEHAKASSRLPTALRY